MEGHGGVPPARTFAHHLAARFGLRSRWTPHAERHAAGIAVSASSRARFGSHQCESFPTDKEYATGYGRHTPECVPFRA